MQKKFLPLLLLPVLILASCGASTPAMTTVGSASSTRDTASSAAGNAGSQSKSVDELQLLNELNAARAVGRNCGDEYKPAVAPVTWNGYLAAAARAHALDMATRNYFAHVTPEGKTMINRAEAAGYTNWSELGENIAAGYTLSEITQGWLDSPEHCDTLMDPALKEVGIGYANNPGSTYGTYWVQDFGTR